MTYGKIITLQPSDRTDYITEDGTELTQRPYPFVVLDNGDVLNGEAVNTKRAVGFTNDLAREQIDLWWRDAVKDPQRVVGKYLVTQDARGTYAVHNCAIMTVTEQEI